jgi:GNAT superfamily N-acetyltransferase
VESDKAATVIRSIEPNDCQRLTEIDEQLTGLSRREWYERKLQHEFGDIHVSIGAEVDGLLVGAILGSVRRGEFELAESVAVIDTILVDRKHQGRGIATAMLERLAHNLRAFGVHRLRTELSWDEKKLNGFLSRRGFHPVERVVMDLDVKEPR